MNPQANRCVDIEGWNGNDGAQAAPLGLRRWREPEVAQGLRSWSCTCAPIVLANCPWGGPRLLTAGPLPPALVSAGHAGLRSHPAAQSVALAAVVSGSSPGCRPVLPRRFPIARHAGRRGRGRRAEDVDQRDVPHPDRRRVQRPQQQLRRRGHARRAFAQAAQRDRRGCRSRSSRDSSGTSSTASGSTASHRLGQRRAGRPAAPRGRGRARPAPGTGRRRTPRPARRAPRTACLQGTPQSGQEHFMSSADGNSGRPSSSKTSTISCGISPASSAARYSACARQRRQDPRPVRLVVRRDRDGHLVRLRTRPLHPAGDLAAASGEVETWPLRAYARPRASRPPSQIRSRMSTNRRDHHCSPILPRLARTAMPPSTRIGLAALEEAPVRIDGHVSSPPPGRARTARAAGRWTARSPSPRRCRRPTRPAPSCARSSRRSSPRACRCR